MLRHDNADLRLTERGRAIGLVDDVRWRRFERRRESISHLRSRLDDTRVRWRVTIPGLGRPESTWSDLAALDQGLLQEGFDDRVIEQVTIDAKYAGYIGRQSEQVERFRRLEDKRIPPDLAYRSIPQLRAEAREKLDRVRPISLGQAARISGISPSDIATLLIHLKRREGELPAQSIDAPTSQIDRAASATGRGDTWGTELDELLREAAKFPRRESGEVRRIDFTKSSQNSVKLSLPRTCPLSDNPISSPGSFSLSIGPRLATFRHGLPNATHFFSPFFLALNRRSR